MTDKKIVVITDLRSGQARCAAQYLEEQGYEVHPVPEDICLWDEAALNAFAAPLQERLRGVIHPAPPKRLGGIEAITRESWNAARDEGPMAAFCVTKVFCELFKKNGQGAIIYLNSFHAEKPMGRGMLFSMGCGAVQMLNREVTQDYAEFGVRSYFVQRGIFEDEMDCRSDLTPIYCGVDLRYPTRQFPPMDQLNGLLAFLLTDAAAPLSGADLQADGGMNAYYFHRRKLEGRPYVK